MLKNSDELNLNAAGLMAKQQDVLGISDSELADSIGYTDARVVALMKSGQMRIPINKVFGISQALDLSAANLMRMILSESAPDQLAAFEQCMGPINLSNAERRVIEKMRRHSGSDTLQSVIYEGSAVAAVIVIS